MAIQRRTGLKRNLGSCFLCPPTAAPTQLIKGRCMGHYRAHQQAEAQKKFAKKQLVNLLLQHPEIEPLIESLFCRDCGRQLTPELDGISLQRGQSYQCRECYLVHEGREVPRHLLFFHSKKYLVKLNLQTSDFQTLAEWYLFQISQSDWVCENCHQPITAMGEAAIYSCQAHILPKEHFPSVALHKLNHLLLGGIFSDCGCHNKFDFSWQKAQKMPVFPLAISRFLSFKNLLSEPEKNKLPEPFIKYL